MPVLGLSIVLYYLPCFCQDFLGIFAANALFYIVIPTVLCFYERDMCSLNT